MDFFSACKGYVRSRLLLPQALRLLTGVFLMFLLACPTAPAAEPDAPPAAGSPPPPAQSGGAVPQGETMPMPQGDNPHAGHPPLGNSSLGGAAQEGTADPHAGHMAPASPVTGSPAVSAPPAPPPSAAVPASSASSAPGTPPAVSPGVRDLLNVKSGKNVPIPSMVEYLGMSVPEGIMMRDERGTLIDVHSLMDMPAIIVPVFYTCPAGCNTLLSSMAATLGGVDLVPGKDFRVISISFDEDDTPERAARKKANYLAAMDRPFPEDGWRFLTGDAASIQHFMGAIGFPYTRIGPGNFSHPLGVIVLAPGGKIVRYMYGQSFLPFDITMAVHEAAQGKVGLSIKRIVSYCFTYDPEARGYVFNFMRVAGVTILFGAGVFLAILLLGGKKKRPPQG